MFGVTDKDNRRLKTVVMKPPVAPSLGLNVFDRDTATGVVITGEKAVYIPSLSDANYVAFANNNFVYTEGFVLKQLSELP